jgi:hypothetical protein
MLKGTCMDRTLVICLIRRLLQERLHWAQVHTYRQHCNPNLVDLRRRQFEYIVWLIQGRTAHRPPIGPDEVTEVIQSLRSCLKDAVGVIQGRCGNRTTLHADVNALLEVCRTSRTLSSDFFERANPGPRRDQVKTLMGFIQKHYGP